MKLARYFQKLFGTVDLADGRIAKFGSLAGGSPAFAANPADVQSQPQFTDGWVEAVMGLNYPAIEDENALDYLWGYQLAYLFQAGIAEWDSSTVYFKDSFAQVGGIVYVCIFDAAGAGQSGNAVTNPTYWAPLFSLGVNSLLNSAFDLWHYGVSILVAYGATALQYVANRWSVWNDLGAGGVITASQVAGVNIGSQYGLKAVVSAAPGAPNLNGVSVLQVLDVAESQKFIDSSGNFSILVKAQGLVTAVTVNLITTLPGASGAPEVITNKVVQASAIVPVTNLGFTLCQVNLNEIPGLAGGAVLGVLITAVAVSGSGHASDLGNGFILEQGMLSAGPAAFARAYDDIGVEESACARYFESSYDDGITPGTVTLRGAVGCLSISGNVEETIYYKSRKRLSAGAVTTVYSSNSGSSGEMYDVSSNADIVGGLGVQGQGSFTAISGAATGTQSIQFQWSTDAEIY